MKTSKVTVTGIIVNSLETLENNKISYRVGSDHREIERLTEKDGTLCSLRDTILKYENILEFQKALENDDEMMYYNGVTVIATSYFDGVYRANLVPLYK